MKEGREKSWGGGEGGREERQKRREGKREKRKGREKGPSFKCFILLVRLKK